MLDVICETSMGVTMNALNDSDSEYIRCHDKVLSLLSKRFRSPIYGNQLIYPYTEDGKEYYKCLNVIQDFTKNVINENIAFSTFFDERRIGRE